jgi:hypothetical protein
VPVSAQCSGRKLFVAAVSRAGEALTGSGIGLPPAFRPGYGGAVSDVVERMARPVISEWFNDS